MWYTKSYNRYKKATVTVEANSREEAEEILDNWLDDNANIIVYTEAFEKNTDVCDYWMSLPQDTPFDKADIKIAKHKPKEPENTSDRVDLAMYFFENSEIKHGIDGRKYYRDITPEEFLALIKDWGKNFILKVDKIHDPCYVRPVIRILATQKPEFSSKIDVNYVEVK